MLRKNKKTNNDRINEFLNWHFKYQRLAFKMSNQADAIGLTGFAWMFEMEASDAFIHARRIINYAQLVDIKAKIDYDCETTDFDTYSILELMKALVSLKQEGLKLTQKINDEAEKAGDYLESKFYEWYLQDFAHEIDEQEQICDYLQDYPESSTWDLDTQMAKSKEPDYELVSKPFSPYHKY